MTDASDQGYGAHWRGHWLSGTWSKCEEQPSIQCKELYAVLLAAVTWGFQWGRKCLLVHCHKHAVVHIWHTDTSKHKSLMILVRTPFFTAGSHNFTILLQHIQGANNSIANALYCSQFHRFRCLAATVDQKPMPTPIAKMCN